MKMIDAEDKMITNKIDIDYRDCIVEGNRAYALVAPLIDKSKEYLKRNC